VLTPVVLLFPKHSLLKYGWMTAFLLDFRKCDTELEEGGKRTEKREKRKGTPKIMSLWNLLE
jgi:hypothetical protein